MLFSVFIHNYIHLSSCSITWSRTAWRFCQICTVTFTSCSLIFACFLLISFSSTLEPFSFNATNKNWIKNIIIISYEQICMVGVGLGTFWHCIMCTNSVTWFCAYLCKTEDTMNYACCNIWCTTCSLLWPLLANISKSARIFSFCF